MEENRTQARNIINALKLLSHLAVDQQRIIRDAFLIEGYDFVFCRKVAQNLNQAANLANLSGESWNSRNVLDFLTTLVMLQDNLYPLAAEGETFAESLKEFFLYMNFPEDEIETLTNTELEKCGQLLFNSLMLDEPEINLINGIVGTSLSLSLKTVFAADGSLRLLIPVATLKITSQSNDDTTLDSYFQLARPDIEEFIHKLEEVHERISTLDKKSEEKDYAEN